MSTLRKHLLAVFLVAGSALPALALQDGVPEKVHERAKVFATCVGYYSAMREHAWLIGSSDIHAMDRLDLFSELLGAVRHQALAGGLTGPELMSYQIEAKMAQARMLQHATFRQQTGHARQAEAVARRRVAMCEALIFG